MKHLSGKSKQRGSKVESFVSALFKSENPVEQTRRQDLLRESIGRENSTSLSQRVSDVNTQRDLLKTKRKTLRLRGQRSTRRSRITPDIFASSLGATKILLGQ